MPGCVLVVPATIGIAFRLPSSATRCGCTTDTAWAVSASRTYEIFNQNSWGRSLHFLAAWLLVVSGVVYLLTGLLTGHISRRLVPRAGELTGGALWRDVVRHTRLQIPRATGGPQYGLLHWFLQDGPKRFMELRRHIPTVSPKVLTQKLRELERHGLVSREHHPEIPPRVEYSMTSLGRSAVPVLKSIEAWWKTHGSKVNKPRKEPT